MPPFRKPSFPTWQRPCLAGKHLLPPGPSSRPYRTSYARLSVYKACYPLLSVRIHMCRSQSSSLAGTEVRMLGDQQLRGREWRWRGSW